MPPDAPWRAGVDVAGPGEAETVLIVFHGGQLMGLWAWTKPDARGDVLEVLSQPRKGPTGEALQSFKELGVNVGVDVIGEGDYFARHLADNGIRVRRVNVANAARNTERFRLLKDEAYWGVRKRFEDGDIALTPPGELRPDKKLVDQLAALRLADPSPRGQIVMEPKGAARKRGVKLPDRAEALMIAFSGGSGDVSSKIAFIQPLDHVAMEDELSAMLGRKVDLVSRRAIERIANWIRRKAILETAEPLYVAR